MIYLYLHLLTLALALSLAPGTHANPIYQLGNHVHKRQNVTTSTDPGIIDIPSPIQHTADASLCQGYRLLGNASTTRSGLDAVLRLIGNCSAYGPDYETLRLQVRYETRDRVRVRIQDEGGRAHVVPTGESYSIGQWREIEPLGNTTAEEGSFPDSDSDLIFDYIPDPFSFSVRRKSDNATLFDTTDRPLIFEHQYLRLTTALNGGTVQGLGQHNDNFSLPIDSVEDYTRTIWTRDAYGLPYLTNLYGAHPVYLSQLPPAEPSEAGDNAKGNGGGGTAHGVFLLNSHGMDIKFPPSSSSPGRDLEYNILGGILDLFIFNGPTPADVIRQYTEVIGRPAEVPYWSLGFHQCRYGTNDIVEAAETVANYSAASIPLEIQWLDIDYMDRRWIMTLDPDRFELDKVRYFVSTLRERGQRFVVMVDPAVASGRPQDDVSNYTTLQDGLRDGVFFKNPRTNETYKGVVWPGPTVFPDFTSQVARDWWTSEFARFFDPETGVDVSGIWLDMNEPASFQPYLEANVDRISRERMVPPDRPRPRVLSSTVNGFEAFRAGLNVSTPFGMGNDTVPEQRRAMVDQVRQRLVTRQNVQGNASLADTEDPSLDSQWLYPPYRIQDRRAPPSSANSDGSGLKNISDFTVRTDVVQSNRALMYAEHNLYGATHGLVTRDALIARKPKERPFIIARSSFSGTGTHNGNWLGDSYSNWEQYSQVIRQMLQFASFGSPIVGADTGGFGGNCTETLLARWAWLGAFNTFYRNHNELGSIGQEFYRYPLSTVAGRAAIQTRLRLLDYIYTFIHKAHVDGTPAMWPLSWIHPEDISTYSLEHQFYFGPALLVSPVIAENSTTVSIYLPNATYYDFFDLTPVQGNASQVTLEDVGYETIPLHILGGNVLPLRTGAANTTAQNHELPFHVVVAPNATGQAYGELRLDDGISLDTGSNFSDITMTFSNNSRLEIAGTFGFQGAGQLELVVFAGQTSNKTIKLDGQAATEQVFDPEHQTLTAWNLALAFEEHVVTLE